MIERDEVSQLQWSASMKQRKQIEPEPRYSGSEYFFGPPSPCGFEPLRCGARIKSSIKPSASLGRPFTNTVRKDVKLAMEEAMYFDNNQQCGFVALLVIVLLLVYYVLYGPV